MTANCLGLTASLLRSAIIPAMNRNLSMSCFVALAAMICWPVQAADSLRISRDDCNKLVRHVPDSGVAYQPGVDVRGREVAPADLNSGLRVEPPDYLTFDIEIDLFDRFGIPVDPTRFLSDNLKVGTVTIIGGRPYFNGEPLYDEEQERLAVLCQSR